MNNLFIDYETFWGTRYSLRTAGMSYTDFIADERFQIHGASVAFNQDQPAFLTLEELGHLFTQLKNTPEKTRLICHNMLFDGMISRLVFSYEADEYFCTLAMLRAMYQGGIGNGLDEAMRVLLGREGKTDIIDKLKDMRTEDIPEDLWVELEEYANEDLEATRELYTKFGIALPPLEHQIMDKVLKMSCHPQLTFNSEVLIQACEEADNDRNSRIENAVALGATPEILKGNKLFPDFLRSCGIDVPMKKNPKGKLIPAFAKTDVGFQQMLESDDRKIRALAEGRLAVKSTQATTRAYRLKKLHEDIGLFPVAYNYAGAHTWRVSGANKVNAANLKRGSKLRTCIEAPKGRVLGVADASQIECRSDGYLAGQDSLMQLFREKRDPYNDMASDIFGKPIDRKGNPDHFFEGFLGKTATLGLGFQMGGPKFKYTVERDAKVNLGLDIDFDLNEAYRIVQLYRKKNWKIEEFWGHCQDFLYAMFNDRSMYWDYGDDSLWIDGKNNKIFFPNDTWLYYPGLDVSDGQFTYLKRRGKSGYETKYIYGGLLCENIVQKFARDITSYHLVKISDKYPVVMHTYDENVAVVPEDDAEEATQWMINLMRIPPKWAESLPLDAEGGWAKEYSK